MPPENSHRTAEQLEQVLKEILASPQDAGRLEGIFVRPAKNERKALFRAVLSREQGVEGDRWRTNHWKRLADGRSDPNSQVSLMNVRALRHIAGSEDAMSLAGDNLIVDLDLSQANLPAGSCLQIGDDVLIEITRVAHTGCAAFSRRYGPRARAFVNSPQGKKLHLRGRYACVVQGGTVHVGDIIRKLSRPDSSLAEH